MNLRRLPAALLWMLVPTRIEDAAKRDAVKNFLNWMLTDGQQFCEPLSYAKLPPNLSLRRPRPSS